MEPEPNPTPRTSGQEPSKHTPGSLHLSRSRDSNCLITELISPLRNFTHSRTQVCIAQCNFLLLGRNELVSCALRPIRVVDSRRVHEGEVQQLVILGRSGEISVASQSDISVAMVKAEHNHPVYHSGDLACERRV